MTVSQRYVEDSANIVNDIDEKCLNGYLQELEQKTGVQMIVLTINTTGDISIETYATEFVKERQRVKPSLINWHIQKEKVN